MSVSRNRDIATILGRSEAANASNTALGTGSGGATVSFVDSDGLLPSADLAGDSGDIVFSRSSNKMFVGEGSYWRQYSTSTINPSVEMLIVGGGGGGQSGGGGAGGLLYYGSETPKTPNGSAVELSLGNTYTVTVGTGGGRASNGVNSSVVGSGINYVATGGGSGAPAGGAQVGSGYTGNAGGSGGGGGGNTAVGSNALPGGAGTAGQGNNGGAGFEAGNSPAGGGGGAGGVGGNATNNSSNGANSATGGAGLAYSITGASVIYAAGGGGGSHNAGAGAGGSSGVGGDGAINSGVPTAPDANTGSGGGGGGYTNANAATISNGADGVVIVRSSGQLTTTGSNVTETQSGTHFVYRFTGNGTFRV